MKTKKTNPNPALPAPLSETFTTHQVCAITGTTPRRVQWWSEYGVLKSDGSWHRPRSFSREQLVRAFVCEQLRNRKVGLKTCRKILRKMEPAIAPTLAGERVVLLLGAKKTCHADHHWILSGDCIVAAPSEVAAAAARMKVPMVACDLGELPERIRVGLEQDGKPQ